MSLTPLSVLRVPAKPERKEQRAIAGPVLERVQRAEPTVPSPAASPRPAAPKQPSAEAQARAIHLSRQKAEGTISSVDMKWLEGYRAPQRGDKSPARRIEAAKLAKAIYLAAQKRDGTLDDAGARRLEDYSAEMKAIELLR